MLNNWTNNCTIGMAEALGLTDKEVVSLIGAGGKTKFMLRLAHELASEGKSVIITTTTRMGFRQTNEANSFVVEDNLDKALQRISSGSMQGKIMAVGRAIDVDGKLVGVPVEWINKFSNLPEVSHIIVEADWACGRSVTINGFKEPRIPSCSTRVASLAGVDIVGELLTVDNVCRPDAVAELTGCGLGEEFTAEAMAQVIYHHCSALTDMPRKCCLYTVLNKVESDESEAKDRSVAHHLLDMGMKKVILASCQMPQPIIDILEPIAV